jgi:transposase
MLALNYTQEILNLQDVWVEKVENFEKIQRIHIKLERKVVNCPCCKAETSKIHDYRTQIVKDCEAFGKKIELVLRKKRYVCTCCNKRFAEPNMFLPKYHRMTSRLIGTVIEKLADERSFTSVARETGLSISTVIRIFDHIQYPVLKTCPSVLSIDEFKGNTGGEKFNVILCDPQAKRVLDILPERKESYLIKYFKQTDRSRVEYFVSDMWKTYSEIAANFFKNATFLVDKYHWVRQTIWAFEAVRKETQKHLKTDVRKYFKRSRSLLIKRYNTLEPEEKQAVNTMLWYSDEMCEAHSIKEWFFKVLDTKDISKMKQNFKNWLNSVDTTALKPFKRCINTYLNWKNGIFNSLETPFTNGFTEGCNNKIKVLKRNAYGYRRFDRFRNRILHIFSHQNAA